MEWPLVRLGDIVDRLTNGFVGPTRNIYVDGGVPYLLARQVKDNSLKFDGRTYVSEEFNLKNKKSMLKKGDVLLVQSGHIGHSAVVPEEHEGHNCHAMIVITPKNVLLSDYLSVYFSFLLLTGGISKIRSGSTVPHLTCKLVRELGIPLPPIPEQKRIVTILDQAFADIEKARANAEQNLKNARELFESYLQQVFGQRGDGWTEEKMSEVCEGKITDGTHQTPKYFDSGHIFLSSKNVTSGVIDWENVKYLDDAQHFEMQKRLSPRLNDILLAKNGTTGVAAIVDRDCVFDIYVSLALLRPSNKILPRYLLHFVNSPIAKRQFNKRLKGIGVPNLHLNEIREVVVSYPVSLQQQATVLDQIDVLLEKKNHLEKIYKEKLNCIDELKKSILQKAFTGELTKNKTSEENAA